MKALHLITFILVAVGGINWGLVGLGILMTGNGQTWNVITMVLGSWPVVAGALYILVGLSTVWLVVMHPKECTMCKAGSSSM